MEVKNVSLVCLVLACVVFNSVQSASFYYRTGREIEIPVENELVREEIVSELKKEPEVIAIEKDPIAAVIVSELKKELEVTAIETEPIASIIKEEVIVPIEQLRVAAPAIEVQEPVAVISEKEETNAIVEETVALRSAGAETIVPVVFEEKIISVPIIEEPVPVSAVIQDIPKTRNEPLAEVEEKIVVPVEVETKDTPIEVVHVAVKSNPIEEAVVEEKENVVIADSPAVENGEVIRQSDGAAAPTTARPTVIQAFQNGIQTFQNQIQSVFNPNAANAATADSSAPTTARPGIIAQFQQAVGQVFNRPGASGVAQGPIQGFVSAVQNNFQTAQTNLQGLFRPNAAAAPAATPNVPVVVAPVDPVGEKAMLEEVPVVDLKVEIVQKVEEKVDPVKSD